MIFVSLGCPSGIGPEVAVRAAARLRGVPRVLVGDMGTVAAAAELVHVSRRRLAPFAGQRDATRIYVHDPGVVVRPADRLPGRPSSVSGVAQLAWVEAAFALARQQPRSALVTGPVSKAAIARSGERRARGFLGHTEWLEALDPGSDVTMCFWSPVLSTSLVTTHLPVSKVPRALDARGVERATLALVDLLRATEVRRPRVAIASLNPHAGESGLLGGEEARAIAPGIERAARVAGRRAVLVGPVGAETAMRRARDGEYDGVVAMYHDQATIPMKLLAFGDAVNVTMGLSVPRTSVDHGTAYDIAWKGEASEAGMRAAMQLAARMASGARRRPVR
jgi:4-hydroxythreonine-4-phosphate dehydrogenase